MQPKLPNGDVVNRRLVVIAALTLLVWIVLAWAIDSWYSTASLLYATVVATIASIVVAAFARPPLNKVSLAFGIGCFMPLAYKLFAHPGRLFGYAVLPLDYSYYRRDLVDILTIWLAGFIAAAATHYAAKRLVRAS